MFYRIALEFLFQGLLYVDEIAVFFPIGDDDVEDDVDVGVAFDEAEIVEGDVFVECIKGFDAAPFRFLGLGVV